MTRGLFISFIVLLAILLLTSTVQAAPVATIWTDKPDYAPGETVIIFGADFLTKKKITVSVTRPDETTDSWSLRSDASGGFTTEYRLDGIVGIYQVTATDGTSTAATSFTDGNREFDQCRNDTNNDDVRDPCVWITGSINKGKSAYREADSVAFRIWLDGLVPGSTHTTTIRYDFTKKTTGGVIVLGYDYLTDPNATEMATSQRCTSIPGSIGTTPVDCGLMSGPSTIPIPSDTFVFSSGLTGVNAALASQKIADRETANPALKQFVMFGGTFDLAPAITITKVGNPDTDSSSQSELTLSFTVGSGAGAACTGPTNCRVIILFGGHLAKGTPDVSGWGLGRGASSFPGASISMRMHLIDGSSSGAVNRGLQPAAVLPVATLIVVKDAVPNDPQNFEFASSFGANFFLDDDVDPTLPNSRTFSVAPGIHFVAEVIPVGWDLTGTSCTDNSPVSAIDLSPFETITCTFTDTKRGEIIVKKVTVGGDAIFPFDLSGGPDSLASPFSLSDGQQHSELLIRPGTYTLKEFLTGFVEWDLTNLQCGESVTTTGSSLASLPVFAGGTATSTLVLDAGETITCTFTDTKRAPTRTQGFWATHFDYTSSKFSLIPEGEKTICGKPVNNIGKLMGAFWSDIAKKTNGQQRSALDQAKMILVQQYFAAVLNKAAFGTDDAGTISAAQTACGTNNRDAILNAALALEAFNKSGDGAPLPPGEDPGSADPEAAQAAANKGFWNTLP